MFHKDTQGVIVRKYFFIGTIAVLSNCDKGMRL